MNLSWSHKLFFKINKQVGKRKWLDRIMFFCANYLIFILALMVIAWADCILKPTGFMLFVLVTTVVMTLGIGSSWLTGLLFSKRRPIVEFPKTKLLFKSWKTWKSFPSDHTIIAFTLVLMPWLFGINMVFGAVLITLAFLVGCARVYAGVHYPRDIVGGIVYSTFFVLVTSIFI